MHSRMFNGGNLRLVDAAVVEDKVDTGEPFARLLRFQIKLHHTFVTCIKKTKNRHIRSTQLETNVVFMQKDTQITK